MLNKQQTNCLKGLAILVIMCHNLLHLMPGAPGENEFGFELLHAQKFVVNLRDHPSDFLKQFFSFFGHYGVQVFIFLSSYGLSIKYFGKNINYKSFIKDRFIKIYPVLVGAIVLFWLFQFGLYILRPNTFPFQLLSMVKGTIARLSLLSNITPGRVFILCGPWWFFSLIFQLYFLFPLLFRLSNKALLIVSATVLIMQLGLLGFFHAGGTVEYLRYNFFGHLPEFCLGIYFAKNKEAKVSLTVFLIAVLIFSIGCINQYFWIFTFPAVPIMVLFFAQKWHPSESSKTYKFFIFFGNYSMYLFAVQGFLRTPIYALGWNYSWHTFFACIVYILLAIVFAFILKYIIQSFTRSKVTTG